MTGRIFDIQRYSIHDGVGIRTIVFFKGCGLRCRWCCNPESQRREIEQMDGRAVGRDVGVGGVMAAVERDRAYYRRSGGGLTLSGGEVLLQADFAAALLRAAQEAGIHTAIETAGMADYSEIVKIMAFVNEFLFDIKHTNTAKHKEFTGRPNDIALANVRQLAEAGAKIIIRVPVIPGFNDTPNEITDIARFAAALPGVNEIHLLPYHRYGEGKYAALNRDYPMQNAASPNNATMESLKSAIRRTCKLEVV